MASFDTAETYTDVVELCALLQCLGFNVKTLDTIDGNLSQDGGCRTVVINCQSSGLNVVLEAVSAACTCPLNNNQNSSFWQVSAVSGGKHHDKQCGSALLGHLPAAFRDRMSRQLREMVKSIREHNDMASEKLEASQGRRLDCSLGPVNKSASMVELNVTPPEKKLQQLKADTPTRYRSLDTLTAAKDQCGELPPPGSLVKHVTGSDTSTDDLAPVRKMVRRQSTYTVASNCGSLRRRNKTSSPIQSPKSSILEKLKVSEKAASDLREQIATIIRECTEEERNLDESSMSALDVSKISLLKGAEPKTQYASSPNISGLRTVQEDPTAIFAQRFYTRASTSSLSSSKFTPKESKVSKLRRLSPSFFKLGKKGSQSTVLDKSGKDVKTPKLASNIQRPRIVTSVSTPRGSSHANPDISASKKKYSHIKSTIPRPASVKKE